MRESLPALVCFFSVLWNAACPQSFTSSNLPIIIINSYSQNVDAAYQEIVVGMGAIDKGAARNYVTDPFNNYNGKVRLHLHGSSSLSLPKKSYTITTIDAQMQKADVPLLGLPAEHDWVLKAFYQDKTFLRDELAFRLFRQMGHYSSRTRFFELVIDGNYRGVYQLEEKVKRDASRVNISKLAAADTAGDELTGGYIISLDKFQQGDPGWYSNYYSNALQDSANYFLYYYPKPDSMPQVQKNYIENFFNRYENALASPWFANPDSGYPKYIDVSSFIDQLLINEISRNVDGYRSSTYFYKDKDSKGGKLHCGPLWDYNLAWDNCYYNGAHNPAGWQYRQFTTVNFVPFWWWQIMSDTSFTDALQCRYSYLRSTLLDTTVLFAYIDNMAAYLDESQARNFVRWPIMGQVVYPAPSPAPPDYAGEIENLKNWLRSRFAWLDANMPGTCRQLPQQHTNSDSIADIIYSYPNPFKNEFSILYKLPEDAHVRIELLDMLGNHVRLLFDGDEKAGSYEEQVDTPGLATGIYFVRVSFNNEVLYRKIIKPGV